MADIDIGKISEALNNKVDLPSPTVPQDAVDYVVERQNPTSANGYTWYRKYKSGWVEQGGSVTISVAANTNTSWEATFPVEMASNSYFHQTSFKSGWIYNTKGGVENKFTTKVSGFFSASNAQSVEIVWEVKGIAATPREPTTGGYPGQD